MFKLIFTNSIGQSVELFGAPYRLFKVEGIGDVEADVQSQKAPYQDGDTFIDSVLEPRYITVELKITGKTKEELSTNRKKLAAVFNPKLGLGVLQYINGNEVKEIMALPESVPIFPDGSTNRGATFQKALIHLKSPNPYWLDQQKTDQLVVWEGGLEFPLELPTFFAKLSNNKSKILVNNGDVESPIFITFNGPATAPIRVSNVTTGKFIEVNQNLHSGERLEINTAFGQKKASKVLADGTKENAFHYIKIPGSEFFGLEVGNNLIDYSTGADYESAGVTISWNDRFVGV